MNKFLKRQLFRYMPDRVIGYNHYRTHKEGIRCWASSGNLLFLHVPKAAGTSINESLNMPDIGHYSYQELCNFDSRFNTKSNIFLVYRSPLSRLMSTYRYAQKNEIRKGYSSLSKVSKYATFDEFVESYLSPKRLKYNYFFKPAFDFLCGADLNKAYIVNFERLADGYSEVLNAFDVPQVKLPVSNATNSAEMEVSSSSIRKINELYTSDIVIEKALINASYIKARSLDF